MRIGLFSVFKSSPWLGSGICVYAEVAVHTAEL